MSDEVTGRLEPVQAPASWQYPFDFNAGLSIEPALTHPGWICRPERIFAAATPAWGLSQADVAAARSVVIQRERRSPDSPMRADADDEDGVAEAFVDLLRHEAVPRVPGFRVVRLVPPPEATGERPVEGVRAADSVVVGERVVVTWVRHVTDGDHAAPRTLAHLDAVDFFGIPETHGILLWTTPSGREVPVAWATRYLPRARDGWEWCVDLAQRALGLDGGGPQDSWLEDFPARLGRLAAKLHVALATPSKVMPSPVGTVEADLVRAWHGVAMQTVNRAVEIARTNSLEGVADVLLPRLTALTTTVDGLLVVADNLDTAPDSAADSRDGHRAVCVQPIHGDLHVGQVMRWPGGLAVVDFHPDPALEFDGLRVGQAQQPAARDVARLLRSLDHVGRVADKSSGFTSTSAVDRWSRAARTQLLSAYRAELASSGRSELLDERLIAPFEAEQLCREIVYANEYLPAWAYAPLGGLWQDFAADECPETGPPARRGRHAVAGITFPAPRS